MGAGGPGGSAEKLGGTSGSSRKADSISMTRSPGPGQVGATKRPKVADAFLGMTPLIEERVAGADNILSEKLGKSDGLLNDGTGDHDGNRSIDNFQESWMQENPGSNLFTREFRPFGDHGSGPEDDGYGYGQGYGSDRHDPYLSSPDIRNRRSISPNKGGSRPGSRGVSKNNLPGSPNRVPGVSSRPGSRGGLSQVQQQTINTAVQNSAGAGLSHGYGHNDSGDFNDPSTYSLFCLIVVKPVDISSFFF